MRKSIYALALGLIGCLSAIAAVPVPGSLEGMPGKKDALSPVSANLHAVKIDNGKKSDVKKNSKHRVGAVDFYGEWKWSGHNALSDDILPSAGVMKISPIAGTDSILITGFEYFSEYYRPAGGLTGYFKDGRLYIPNQFVSFENDPYGPVEFLNYTIRNFTQEEKEKFYEDYGYWPQGEGQVIPAPEGNDFFFAIDESTGNLTSVQFDEQKNEYTDAELARSWAAAADVIPGYGNSYYWLCDHIVGNPLEFFEFNPSEWNEVGKARFQDPWFAPVFIDEAPWLSEPYDVPCFQSFKDPDKFLLLNPYGPDTPWGEIGLNSNLKRPGYIVFDISNPEVVIVEPLVYALTNDGSLIADEEAEFYCYNMEGYYSHFQNMSAWEIQNKLWGYGQEISWFEEYTGTVYLYNPCFDIASRGLGQHLYWSNTGNVEGFIEIPLYSHNKDEMVIDGILYRLGEIGGENFASIAYASKDLAGDITIPETIEVDGTPYTVYFLEDNAFENCVNITGINLPESITGISMRSFYGCTSLEVLKIPEAVSIIPSYVFSGCSNLEKVYIPGGVTSIDKYAFQHCTSLRSIIIPEGVPSIPEGMMYGCSSLTEILIPNSVVTIGSRAFEGCSSLRNVDLGTQVYEIANYAFEGCNNIKDIHSMALYPPYADMYTFPIEAYDNAIVTVQEQSLTQYKAQDPWYRFKNYLTVAGSISLSHYNVDMAGNEVFQLGVYGADSKISWSSSNPSVAYANECGLIVAMGITGSTVITADVDGEQIRCNVVVSSPRREARVARRVADEEQEDLEPVAVIIESIGGNPPMVNARLIPVGSCTVIDWTTTDSEVASVENGLVTIHSEGEVEFGVETENGLDESYEVDTTDINSSTSGVQGVGTADNANLSAGVYDLTGRLVLVNASEDQIRKLNKGIYIANGKKVVVK